MKAGKIILSVGVALVTLLASSATFAQDLKQADVENIIKEYLIKEPKIVVDALKKWKELEKAEKRAAQRKMVKSLHTELMDDKTTPFAGNADGDVKIVEFFDYNCPYCKAAFTAIDELVKKDDKVKVYFKEFPIFGAQSNQNAKAMLSVYLMDKVKYFPIHEAIMAKKGRISIDGIMEIVTAEGIDPEDVKKKMGSDEVNDILNKNKALASKLGLTGTPGFIIGENVIPSVLSYKQLKQLVESERITKRKK